MNSFTRVIVVDASSQAQLEADLEQSIRSLGPEYSKTTWKDAVAHLDGKEKGWLLFVDNADSLDLRLDPYLPASIHGTILITTRNGECVGYAPDGAVPVGDLEENEAVALLHAIANVKPASDADSLEIVRELGMLALAITQAGAYVRKTRQLDKYLETFRSHRDRLMRKQPEMGAGYTSSTYAAFDLSFQQLPAKTQKLLILFAFLHYSLIPVALFEQSVVSGYTARTVRRNCLPPEIDKAFISHLEETLGTTWDGVVFQELVDSASRASLINVSADGLSYSVHPLFQTYVKDSLDEEEVGRHRRTTAQLLLGAIRPVEGSNAQHWQLLPHVNNIPRPVQSESVAHALAFYEFYKSLGNWKECRGLLESAVSEILATRGQRDADSIGLMNILAAALHDCGQLDEAEKMRREVLALRLDIHGERHPDTIGAMGNLARTLRKRGQLDEAERMQRDALTLQLDIRGERHPDTIVTMTNLALTLYTRGQLDKAERMQREVLALQLDIHGKRHPETIKDMNNLANTLYKRGQLDEAERIKWEVLTLRLDILGGRHPETIDASYNLARTLYQRGQLEEVKSLLETTMKLRVEVLGEHHPHTVGSKALLRRALSALS